MTAEIYELIFRGLKAKYPGQAIGPRFRAVCAALDDWDENKHPRKDNGQFGAGSGGKATVSKTETVKKVQGQETNNGKVSSLRRALEKTAPHLFKAINFALTGKPVSSITGKEFQKDGVKLTDKVPQYYQDKYEGKVTNAEIGEVKLDLEGVKDDLAHGMGSLKAAAFMCVPEVIQNGVIFDRQENRKDRGYDSYVLIAPVLINGERYIEEVVVKRQTNRQGLYLHEVEIQKRLEDAFKTPTEGSASPASKLIIGKKIDNFKAQNGNKKASTEGR